MWEICILSLTDMCKHKYKHTERHFPIVTQEVTVLWHDTYFAPEISENGELLTKHVNYNDPAVMNLDINIKMVGYTHKKTVCAMERVGSKGGDSHCRQAWIISCCNGSLKQLQQLILWFLWILANCSYLYETEWKGPWYNGTIWAVKNTTPVIQFHGSWFHNMFP